MNGILRWPTVTHTLVSSSPWSVSSICNFLPTTDYYRDTETLLLWSCDVTWSKWRDFTNGIRRPKSWLWVHHKGDYAGWAQFSQVGESGTPSGERRCGSPEESTAVMWPADRGSHMTKNGGGPLGAENHWLTVSQESENLSLRITANSACNHVSLEEDLSPRWGCGTDELEFGFVRTWAKNPEKPAQPSNLEKGR